MNDYYDQKSLIWLGSYTRIHDYRSAVPEVWVNHTITRQLRDIDYVGEDPHEDDYDNPNPYDIWKDPVLWVAVGVVAGIAIGLGILIHFVRKRSREWQLAEIEKFEADRNERPMPPTNGESM